MILIIGSCYKCKLILWNQAELIITQINLRVIDESLEEVKFIPQSVSSRRDVWEGKKKLL
jgi:hypothetical protein